jgi:signal transduction histidine kinase
MRRAAALAHVTLPFDRPGRPVGHRGRPLDRHSSAARQRAAYNGTAVIAVSLLFLVVYIFGVFAYGAFAVMSLRRTSRVWAAPDSVSGPRSADYVSRVMFVLCTVWFVLHSLRELVAVGGLRTGADRLDLMAMVLSLVFPPLIMHLVYQETTADDGAPPSPVWRRVLAAMYILSPATGAYLVAAIFKVAPHPSPLGPFIGGTIGGMFILASFYSMLLMSLRRPRDNSPAQRDLRKGMLSLFSVMTVLFAVPFVFYDRALVMFVVDKTVRTTPLFFLVLATYFENRFEFHDQIVKRGVMFLGTVIGLGGVFALLLPWIDALPATTVRSWLAAIVLAAIVLALPPLYRRLGRWMDRAWFRRTFTPVDAVKHVLAAMQPAIDEATLIDATERQLSGIFDTPVAVLLDGETPRHGAGIDLEVSAASPVSGTRVRFAVLRRAGSRPLLSEDLALLHSLAGVFGFMLENIRLQRKRQEQEQVATALRLQASHSELKALRAQINPHFLFNALNAIASLIHTDPRRADAAVEQLAEVFRYTLRRSDSEWAPLDQEVAFARAYLDVEQARFGERLSCSIDSDHRSPAPQVPSMLLQTLIENAVKHGVSQVFGRGRIHVRVRTTRDQVRVEVRDNGPGPGAPAAGPRAGQGFGLRSVRDRLAGHFGGRATLSLTRDDAAGETVAIITMPVVTRPGAINREPGTGSRLA